METHSLLVEMDKIQTDIIIIIEVNKKVQQFQMLLKLLHFSIALLHFIFISSNKSDDDEWEDVDNNDDDKKKQSSTQSLNNNNKRSQRYAPCWTYFSVARGKHPITKEACDMCYCKIKVDGNKECGVSFVKHNNTTHLNDHLFNEHKKEEFRPKRMMGPGDVQDINVLLAKFIISSNSAFRICENKYLKV